MPILKVGPRYGWVIVASLALLLAAMHGLITSGMSVFDKSILTDLGIGRGALKFRELLQLTCGGLFSIMIGFVAGRTGPRAIIYLGLGMLSAVMLLYSQVTTATQIYPLHVALAFCYVSCHVVVVVLIITRWFETRRSVALGIILAGESLGGTIFPQIVVRLIEAFGWRGSMQLLALMPLALAAVMLLTLREGPEAHGIARIGHRTGETLAGMEAGPATAPAGFTQTLLSPATLLLLGAAAFIFYAGSSFINHAFLSFLDRGFDARRAATALSILFSAAFIGKFASGFFAERLGLHRSWIAGQFILLLGAALFAFSGGKLLWLGIVLLGYGWGSCYTLTQSLVMEQFSGPWLARLSGIAVFVEGSLSGLGTWLAGAMFDRTGSYTLPFLIMVVALAAGIFASIAVVRPRRRQPAPTLPI